MQLLVALLAVAATQRRLRVSCAYRAASSSNSTPVQRRTFSKWCEMLEEVPSPVFAIGAGGSKACHPTGRSRRGPTQALLTHGVAPAPSSTKMPGWHACLDGQLVGHCFRLTTFASTQASSPHGALYVTHGGPAGAGAAGAADGFATAAGFGTASSCNSCGDNGVSAISLIVSASCLETGGDVASAPASVVDPKLTSSSTSVAQAANTAHAAHSTATAAHSPKH